ncbi:MAG: methyltransferase domain-containing protein [Bryobacterales bacterium]|nr:methyltransferase domain-containing protein [Bryobacterales bacterium]MBV9401336.1 methyltransferase domain-containing protein [Bryobacterales bacterium]
MQIQDFGPMQLGARRRKIADASGGTSGNDLRTTVFELIRELDLRGAVADIGAGKGDVIRSFLEMHRFSSITAFDLMERPPDLPPHVQWQHADLNQPIACPAHSFDVVTCLGLIEYLENPYAFARELHRVLRPGGTAILTTPNNENWRRLISLVMRGHFVTSINLTTLVRSDFEKILRFAGFRHLRFSYSRSGMVPKLLVSWQAISGGILRGLRYSDDLVVSCQS